MYFPAETFRGRLDLGFVLHASEDIGSLEWEKIQQFAQALADRFEVSAGGTHVGVVRYGDSASTILRFNTYTGGDINEENVRRTIRGLATEGTRNTMNNGLTAADDELFNLENGMRERAMKVEEFNNLFIRPMVFASVFIIIYFLLSIIN